MLGLKENGEKGRLSVLPQPVWGSHSQPTLLPSVSRLLQKPYQHARLWRQRLHSEDVSSEQTCGDVYV